MGMVGAPGMRATITPAPASMAGYGNDKRRATCSKAIAASKRTSRLWKNVIRVAPPGFKLRCKRRIIAATISAAQATNQKGSKRSMPRAVRFDHYGGLEVLQVVEAPRPVP